MTRKEICEATGLSVKTLRLYEEKGLIAPAKTYRNGREYREYTPELQQQLQQIAILRRALFTMDEIKTMQESPDQIPHIFAHYAQWLEQQEQQFHQLRQAAKGMALTDLCSTAQLTDQLSASVSRMPLPTMDLKPNFKRLDATEESPRHVEPQTVLDETVPDARTFRQVNLMLDKDRTNDIHLAFRQYNDLRKLQKQESSGPVQKTYYFPRWFRLLSGFLTLLVLVSLGLAAHYATRLWPKILFVVLLLLRIVFFVAPRWLEHRRWLRAAQQSDAARQGGQEDPHSLQKRRQKRSIILLTGVAGGILLAGLVLAVYTHLPSKPNFRVAFAVPAHITSADLNKMEKALRAVSRELPDTNGFYLALDEICVQQYPSISNYGPEELAYLITQGEYPLAFISDLEWDSFNIYSSFDFEQACRTLPEDLASPENPYGVDLSGTALFRAIELEDLSVYGCISQSATQEEYDFAVALLRTLAAS